MIWPWASSLARLLGHLPYVQGIYVHVAPGPFRANFQKKIWTGRMFCSTQSNVWPIEGSNRDWASFWGWSHIEAGQSPAGGSLTHLERQSLLLASGEASSPHWDLWLPYPSVLMSQHFLSLLCLPAHTMVGDFKDPPTDTLQLLWLLGSAVLVQPKPTPWGVYTELLLWGPW